MTSKSDAQSSKLLTDTTTLLAVTRTRLAAERTLMAWIRTAFSMITFGFGLLKLYQYLAPMRALQAVQSSSAVHLGIFLILLGILSLIPGTLEYHHILKEMNKYDGKTTWSYTFAVAILVAIIGIYALSHTLATRFV